MTCHVEDKFMQQLIAQPVQEQASRMSKVNQALRYLDEAMELALSGMTIHACGRVGQARSIADDLGLLTRM